jgi:DNA polymerase-1
MSNVLLIDGNNLVCQTLGKPPLCFNGKRTEAIKISMAMLRSYIVNFDPEKVVVFWDGGRDERRIKIYPDYKKRKEQTEAERAEKKIFFEQMDEVRELFSALGIEQIRVPGREADDVIYSYLEQNIESYGEAQPVIVSTDADMFQILSYYAHGKVLVFSPVKKILIDRVWVEEKYGIAIEDFVIWKSLVGDTSDNIPGIRGIGPIRAKKLINEKRVYDEINLGELLVQLELVLLYLLDEKEIMKGEILCATKENILDRAIELFEKYGFEQPLGDVASWVGPFLRLRKAR